MGLSRLRYRSARGSLHQHEAGDPARGAPWCTNALGPARRRVPRRARVAQRAISFCRPSPCPRTQPRHRGRITPTVDKPVTATAKTVLAAAQQRSSDEGLPYYGAIVPAEAQALLDALPNARLIDVRTRAEWDYVGRIPGSILIEWTTYPSGGRNPAFLEQLQAAAADPQAPVLFICRSGQRSDSAARVAAAAGYSMAFNVLEGFEGAKDAQGHRGTLGGWRKAGLPWIQG